jgi:glycosyltransferase involved in cell wall biosynthesis
MHPGARDGAQRLSPAVIGNYMASTLIPAAPEPSPILQMPLADQGHHLGPRAGQMHILLLAPAIADYCVEYANALAKEKMTVTLLAPESFFKDQVRFVDSAVHLRLLNWPRHRSVRNAIFFCRLIFLIDHLQPDVVHFLSEGVTWLSFLPLFLSRKYGIVTTMHDVTYHLGDHASQRVPRWFANRLVAQSDKVLVHGANLRSDAERQYPGLVGKIAVIPHLTLSRYCYIAKRAEMCRTDDPTVNVLFFGRIYAYKGVDILIRSAPLVLRRFRNIKFIIAGRGENFDKYEDMILDPSFFEIRNRHIPDTEVAQLFTDADIVVLPYVEASQSGVLAIANAFGKAVVVTDVGELASAVKDGETGIIIPAKDEGALAEAIFRLAADANFREVLGNSGRVAAEQWASPKLIGQTATEIYKTLIPRENPGMHGVKRRLWPCRRAR